MGLEKIVSTELERIFLEYEEKSMSKRGRLLTLIIHHNATHIDFFELTRMCHNIIKHSFNENIKELIRLFVNFILKWKTEIFYKFSTLRIFYTPHFPHSAFSTLRTLRFPLNRLRAENSFPAKLLFASCERPGFRHFIG